MSGNKNSGRKPNFYHVDIDSLLNKSNIIMHEFFSSDAPLEKKAEFASRFLVKKVGEKIDISVSHMLDKGQMSILIERVKNIIDTNPVEVYHAIDNGQAQPTSD